MNTSLDGPMGRVERKSVANTLAFRSLYEYSSVHYLIQPRSKAKITFEIQVRTLADEIWSEIDHKINYPHPHESLACREQIKALARVASSCSRLVDSIVASHRDWEERQNTKPPTA